ncbi:MAG: sulfite exporter TauE/SafE family protein [Spirochaetes bacterium]|nr:sulfite exporter TauE/SafE family protein [Spirochaetota bacterium]
MSGDALFYIAIGFVILVSAFVQGISGFGMALVSMSILPFLLPLRIVTPLVLLNGFAVTVVLFIAKRDHFELRDLIPLLASATVGIPFGIYILVHFDDRILQKILAILIFLYCIYSLANFSFSSKISERWTYLFGFLAGSLGAAFNINGPPVIIHAMLQQWEKDRMLANLQAFFLFSTILIGIGHCVQGFYTREVIMLWLSLLPINIIGTVAGIFVNKQVNNEQFKKIILILLIVSSILLGIR